MGALAQEPRLSAGLTDIVKLSQANAGPAVIESFINNSPIAYSPTSDEIIFLRKQGVSDQVLAALLRHGAEIRQQANAAAAAPPYQPQQPQQAWPSSGGQVPMPGSPAPNVGPGPDYGVPATPVVDPVPAYTYNDGYYWGSGYWGWNGGAYLWIGPGWRWGGWGGGWGRGYGGWGYGGWGRGVAGWGHGGYGGYGGYGGHFGGGARGGVGHAGGGGGGVGHAGGGHGGGGHGR